MIQDAWIKNVPIAHRGLWSDNVPENSLRAFKNAVVQNVPIELDVQMLRDRTLVIFHDRTLGRMTAKKEKLSSLVWSDIADVDLLNTDQKIPQLQDVLHIINGSVPLLIEMKDHSHNRTVYIDQLFDVLQDYAGVYALSSFDPFLVKKAKKKFGNISCGQNFSDHKKYGCVQGWIRKIFMYGLWAISDHHPDFFVCRVSMLFRCWVVRVAQNHRVPLLVWGVTRAEGVEVIKKGGDNYIFDNE